MKTINYAKNTLDSDILLAEKEDLKNISLINNAINKARQDDPILKHMGGLSGRMLLTFSLQNTLCRVSNSSNYGARL